MTLDQEALLDKIHAAVAALQDASTCLGESIELEAECGFDLSIDVLGKVYTLASIKTIVDQLGGRGQGKCEGILEELEFQAEVSTQGVLPKRKPAVSVRPATTLVSVSK